MATASTTVSTISSTVNIIIIITGPLVVFVQTVPRPVAIAALPAAHQRRIRSAACAVACQPRSTTVTTPSAPSRTTP
eukprot:6191065-Pleurochrysis_carterae.AAC.1